MPADPYLFRLAARLQTGAAHLDPQRRKRHADFVRARQQPDGGFVGREGDSDLYYTSFAVRSLALLDALDEPVTRPLAEFLRGHDWRRLGVIDLMNWLWLALTVELNSGISLIGEDAGRSSDEWADQIAARLESVRSPDGGYAKSPAGASGSTYHTFLVVLTYEMLGRLPPRPGALTQFLYDRQRDDGGFVEIAPMRRSGTNPTAAAAAVLQLLDALDDDIRQGVRDFLREVRSDEGGIQANSRIPFADGLSTFTALLTLQDLQLVQPDDEPRIRNYVEANLEFPTGGFRAASWDEAADVEYTFYGLATLALLVE
jgi:geranylgeranyl transferase type-2 subunit beta